MYRRSIHLTLLALLGLLIAGCSSEDNDVEDHVWKDQVETIDKAREVEGMIQDAAGKQKKATEDSGY